MEAREIKFRLRDKNNKIVGYEKWYVGSWKEEPLENYPNISRYIASPCWLYSTDNDNWTPNYIPHRYKDQYIGLTDKNYKEIYGGDVIKYWGKCFRIGYLAASFVAYHLKPEINTVNTDTGEWLHELDDMDSREVIGNRWENPELLEVSNGMS